LAEGQSASNNALTAFNQNDQELNTAFDFTGVFDNGVFSVSFGYADNVRVREGGLPPCADADGDCQPAPGATWGVMASQFFAQGSNVGNQSCASNTTHNCFNAGAIRITADPVAPSPVPEPGTMALTAFGLGVLVRRLKRRNR
jgi:hypothetical protein